MSRKKIQTNNVNGFQPTEQGPSSSSCSQQEKIVRHHESPVISKRRKWTSQENKIIMECCLLSEPKIRKYRKRMLSLWLQKGMFWVSEQKLVDSENNIRRNRRMTVLQIEELKKKVTGSDSVIVEERRSFAWSGRRRREKSLEEMAAEEQTDSLDKDEVAIVIEIAVVRGRGRKDKLPGLRNVPKKKLLQETAKVDKVLSRFKTHSIKKTNDLFYAGAFVVANRLGVK